MTDKNRKNNEELKTDKSASSESKLVTIKLPSNFPFQDLSCHQEHKELLEGMFGLNCDL